MAATAITITKSLSDLKQLFNKMSHVYYVQTANSALGSLASFNAEIPVTEDGVSFDTGSADITRIKLTTGANWASLANPGDADISFQVPSVAGFINDLLMNKVTATTVEMASTVDGITYSGEGYSLSPKKVVGGLFMTSADKESALFLPNVEMYSNFVAGDSSKPAYFNVAVTPLEDTDGAAIYILSKKTA